MRMLASADWRREVLSRMWRSTKVRWRLLLCGITAGKCMWPATWAGQLPRRPFTETIPRRPSKPELMSGSTDGTTRGTFGPGAPLLPVRSV
jgi:hypothetical protein